MFEILSQAAAFGSAANMWDAIVYDFSNLGAPGAMQAFIAVLFIDLVLAGDNAIAVGALAAGLPPEQRRKVIMIGVAAALILRIIFALTVTYLLTIIGLKFVGGLLLVWVAWGMWKEFRPLGDGAAEVRLDGADVKGKSFAAAAWAVAIADVSMSLDNVLAVAGAASAHPGIMIVGLIIAVVLMGVAANIIAKYIERYKWIAYVGIIVIVYVAGKMIYEGIFDPSVGILILFG